MYEQKLFTTKATKWIALAGNLISSFENIHGILGLNEIYIDNSFYNYVEWVPGSSLIVSVGETCKKDILNSVKELLRVDNDLANLVIAEGRTSEALYHWRTLYSRVLEVFLDNMVGFLKSKTVVTNSKRIEYMLLVSRKGEGVVLQGDVDRIRIPRVRAWLIAHTHPSPHSFFSPKDMETSRDLFVNQGLLSAVVTSTTICVLYRCGDMDVDDYEKLILIERKLAKGKVREALKLMSRLKSVRLVLKGVHLNLR
ncbi:MAG: hypothetical protein B6U76_08995 [Desulfurococcales archaeon ex4484_217_2]|nr:MAG: hypothetical protein B6U76_08995 [Desulfurococcales archaeon ex4484_217_2]